MRLRRHISASPPETDRGWHAWCRAAPRIVAESLAAADPLRVGLVAGAPAAPAEVARAIAAKLTPAERELAAPGWLLKGQQRSYRRVLAALDRFGGALLANAVGSGKTYIALAAAAAYRAPAVCLAPAALVPQWRALAAALGASIEVTSHQQASRGNLPRRPRGIVILDESHHFRNPRTRRYHWVAPWLVGRRVLLLSATPVVNRLEDLAHQLLLGVRDDALLPDGIASLRGVIASGRSDTGVGRLVIEETTDAGPRPIRSVGASEPSASEDQAACVCLTALGRLRLSMHRPTAALMHGVLLRAAASSLPALAGALARYRALLRHAGDARRAGRQLSRAELREFAGTLDEQLVWWELMPEGGGAVLELALDDADLIGEVLAEVAVLGNAPDLKLERLRALLSDGRPTLVFTTRRETARHLRQQLSPPVAWCTGERAGVGHVSASRAEVMRWFREPVDHRLPAPPACLVTTDVAAEGLDLRRAERVVHYDLPWTPMRLEQREGRAVRLGSAHRTIEVVPFPPPPAFEAALRLGARLARKARLPGRAGLGKDGVGRWRWRSMLADHLGGGPGTTGTALVSGSCADGALAGYELWARGGTVSRHVAAIVGWLDEYGEWTEDPGMVTPRMIEAGQHRRLAAPSPCSVHQVLDRLAVVIRGRLALAAGSRWSTAEPAPAARRLVERLGQEIALAARHRDERRLERLERALAFASGGHTAGEAMLVQRMAEADGRRLAAWVERAPEATPRWDLLEVQLTGVIVFRR